MSDEKAKEVDNSIGPQEFADVEYKEKRSSGPFGLFRKKPAEESRAASSSQPQGEDNIVQLSVKLERLAGRLETLEETRRASEERLSDISEKIGELRSSLMDRDRTFSEAMVKFERLSETAEGLEPDKLKRELAKRDQQLEQVKTEVESNKEKISMMVAKQKDIADVMEEIKGMKDLVSVAEELNKKIKIMEGIKADTEKISAKFEAKLYDMNETIGNMKASMAKISANDDAIKELVRTVDSLALKLEHLATKDEANAMEKGLSARMAELKFDTESRFTKVLEAFKLFDDTSGEKGYSALNRKLREVSEEFAEYKKANDEKLSRISGLEEAVKGMNDTMSQKAVLGFEQIMESGGGNLESTIVGEIRRMLKEEDERHNSRFADMELKLLELSKSVDNRIEKKVSKESRATREAVMNIVDSGSEKGRFEDRPVSKPLLRSSTSKDYFQDLNSLVKDVYFFLDSKNYENARTAFIKLLSLYERQESSNPFILAKITDLHKRIKEIS